MFPEIKERLRNVSRRMFPASIADVTCRHDAVMMRLEKIEGQLSTLPALQEALVELQAEMRRAQQKLDDFRWQTSGVEFLLTVAPNQLAPLFRHIKQSRSQIWQDLFVLAETNLKKNGFFVEFGATNGVTLSNTYLLETEYGWNGILAEPARCWHAALAQNRKCAIERKSVWRESGSTLLFDETSDPELSTIHSFQDVDFHHESRTKSQQYDVETISLVDMLDAHKAPNFIDYLSIDTEGSEFEILNAFDFDQYRFGVITCEHNFTEARGKIYDLLTSKGYLRKHERVSQWDDWYVRA